MSLSRSTKTVVSLGDEALKPCRALSCRKRGRARVRRFRSGLQVLLGARVAAVPPARQWRRGAAPADPSRCPNGSAKRPPPQHPCGEADQHQPSSAKTVFVGADPAAAGTQTSQATVT